MAHRKQLPQPRTCAQCPTVFVTARKGTLYCSSACNTRAWRQRQPAAPPKRETGASLPAPLAAPAAESAVTLATNFSTIGTVAIGTMAGNFLTDLTKQAFTPAAVPAAAPPTSFPTWPPAELLTQAGPAVWVTDPAWASAQLLSPVPYHGHLLYLHVQAGLTWVLWQAPSGEWQPLRSPAELEWVATQPPVSSLQRIQQRYEATQAALPALGEASVTTEPHSLS